MVRSALLHEEPSCASESVPATHCFVVQHLRTHESDVGSPSGTLTVVRELVKHWDRSARLVLLCNQDYANMAFLEGLRDEHGVKLEVCSAPTVQDLLARLSYAGERARLRVLRKRLVRLLAPFITLRAFVSIRQYLLRNEVDVIYSHAGGYPFSNLNVLAVLAGRFAGVKQIFLISHNLPNRISAKRLPFSFVQDRLVARLATRVLSVSESAAKAHDEGRLFGRKVGWVYNGIETSTDMADELDAPAWRGGEPVIMFMGSLVPRKGLNVLMEALANVSPPWQLVIYGSGSPTYTDGLKRLAHELNIANRVIFAGFERRAPQLLKYCDLLVLPSVGYESFGMVLLEAMRHAKAVVCTDVGGMKEVVEHGRTGLVVRAGHTDELREAITYLLEDAARLQAMGECGRRRLLERFDVRKTVRDYAELVR